ncbi:peroxiredoxin [Niastella koreensis]|uniref:Alkyl hydroperoxide reductase/ Thiol specific antioxidant/ Mal allergen n=2 Tax=Niastella koreensis TaxID=354356 RepID=G8THC2_NIAKG|nr:redoxin domain-containing protein [Niastella koreensis]AEW01732.1 alkyl hydroperoxide reductase/ Thiol specific antioxidant/ Mal allergen [Niastella koreensis GR20-10]OQP48441.1 peroxiredoxin [Niastella koreensis]
MIGSPAPDFTLFDSAKNQVSLHSLKGKKVILLFFPFAFSSTCTRELCYVRDNLSQFNNVDAAVLGISVDSLYTLAKYKEDQGFQFTLLSDFNKEVSRLYNAIYENWNYNMKGVSKRASFVIDRKGIVQYAQVLVNAGDMPDFEAIEASLAAIN